MNLILKIIAGPLAFGLILLFSNDSLPDDAWSVIGVAAWMLIWWVSEAVPIAVASLLPVLLFPMTGVMDIKAATAPYGSHYVFLFLGGFILAIGLEKWNLHKRIALGIVNLTGDSANRIILGFMLASALLSMWISNTATTLMMLPIATSVIGLLVGKDSKGMRRFSLAMLLGVAYAANVGGIATIIGTPPNAAMAGIIEENYGIAIGFLEWMQIGLPFSLLMLGLVFLILVFVIYPNKIGKFQEAADLIDRERASLGKWNRGQFMVIGAFALTALLWITRSPLNELLKTFSSIQLSDAGIAIGGSMLLFVLFPGGEKREPLLKWDEARKLPWGILLLFGGGLALAAGFKQSGLVEIIASAFDGLGTAHLILMVIVLTFVSLFLTELMSNLALVNVFVPVVAAIAIGFGESPLLLAVPVTLAASCAFMFPMSTPPNAIVFASGHIKIAQMARAGILLNLVAVVVTAVFCYFVLDWWLV